MFQDSDDHLRNEFRVCEWQLPVAPPALDWRSSESCLVAERRLRSWRAKASNVLCANTPAHTVSSATYRKKDDIHPVAMQIVGMLGGLDVLINNASDRGLAPLGMLADTECDDLERALATNVLGPVRLTKVLLGALASSTREGRGAVVLNVLSDAAPDGPQVQLMGFANGLRLSSHS